MPLKNPNQRSEGGTFTQAGKEPLSKKVRGVRLPVSIDEVIESRIPESERSAWLRSVIVEAVKRQFLNQE